jgi:hypothetical protein
MAKLAGAFATGTVLEVLMALLRRGLGQAAR